MWASSTVVLAMSSRAVQLGVVEKGSLGLDTARTPAAERTLAEIHTPPLLITSARLIGTSHILYLCSFANAQKGREAGAM